MREAMGGTMLFYIVLIFVALFIGFLSAVTQYGRVFKQKNTIVNYIEQAEGIPSKAALDEKLTEMGYKRNYLACKYDSNRGSYYTITLYAVFALPFLPELDMTIKGETRLIEVGVNITDDSIFTGENGCFSREGM